MTFQFIFRNIDDHVPQYVTDKVMDSRRKFATSILVKSTFSVLSDNYKNVQQIYFSKRTLLYSEQLTIWRTHMMPMRKISQWPHSILRSQGPLNTPGKWLPKNEFKTAFY